MSLCSFIPLRLDAGHHQRTHRRHARGFPRPYISHDPALWTVLNELKLAFISSSSSRSDWDVKVPTDQIIATCSQAGAGDIVILHTWPGKNADALPAIIAGLRTKALSFITISELLPSRGHLRTESAAHKRAPPFRAD